MRKLSPLNAPNGAQWRSDMKKLVIVFHFDKAKYTQWFMIFIRESGVTLRNEKYCEVTDNRINYLNTFLILTT